MQASGSSVSSQPGRVTLIIDTLTHSALDLPFASQDSLALHVTAVKAVAIKAIVLLQVRDWLAAEQLALRVTLRTGRQAREQQFCYDTTEEKLILELESPVLLWEEEACEVSLQNLGREVVFRAGPVQAEATRHLRVQAA